MLRLSTFPDDSCCLVPVKNWHTDIHKDNIRFPFVNFFDCCRTVVNHVCLHPENAQ